MHPAPGRRSRFPLTRAPLRRERAEGRHHSARLGADLNAGQFTDWEEIESETDLLFYEGLHGLVKTDNVDLTRYVDLKVGVVPVVNLEWIQKIRRDSDERGSGRDEVVDSLSRSSTRMS